VECDHPLGKNVFEYKRRGQVAGGDTRARGAEKLVDEAEQGDVKPLRFKVAAHPFPRTTNAAPRGRLGKPAFL
jgi:hypothetical protein